MRTHEIERLLSPREAANRLGVSVATVRRLIRSGALPAVRIGCAYRVDADELEDYIYGTENEAA